MAGDLYLTIRLSGHPELRVEGEDVRGPRIRGLKLGQASLRRVAQGAHGARVEVLGDERIAVVDGLGERGESFARRPEFALALDALSLLRGTVAPRYERKRTSTARWTVPASSFAVMPSRAS